MMGTKMEVKVSRIRPQRHLRSDLCWGDAWKEKTKRAGPEAPWGLLRSKSSMVTAPGMSNGRPWTRWTSHVGVPQHKARSRGCRWATSHIFLYRKWWPSTSLEGFGWRFWRERSRAFWKSRSWARKMPQTARRKDASTVGPILSHRPGHQDLR